MTNRTRSQRLTSKRSHIAQLHKGYHFTHCDFCGGKYPVPSRAVICDGPECQAQWKAELEEYYEWCCERDDEIEASFQNLLDEQAQEAA
jgi:hypothetical protein